MQVLKADDGNVKYYFSTISKMADFFGKKGCSITYAMKYDKAIDGFKFEWTDDYEIRVCMVDNGCGY